MKKCEIEDFIIDNKLLQNGIAAAAGIYAITIEGYIVYVGQSKDIYRRCCEHIYNTQNAMFIPEKKYRLLLAAWLGGYSVDCSPLEYCEEEQLNEREKYWITEINPMLNTYLTPGGKHDVNKYRLGDVINNMSMRPQVWSKTYLGQVVE